MILYFYPVLYTFNDTVLIEVDTVQHVQTPVQHELVLKVGFTSTGLSIIHVSNKKVMLIAETFSYHDKHPGFCWEPT